MFSKTGLASPSEHYRVFYAERCPWWLIIKATGAPGHGAKLYDNSAMENILKSIESVRRFRASQFDLVKAGLKAEGEVVSVNMAFLKAGTPTPTVSLLIPVLVHHHCVGQLKFVLLSVVFYYFLDKLCLKNQIYVRIDSTCLRLDC